MSPIIRIPRFDSLLSALNQANGGLFRNLQSGMGTAGSDTFTQTQISNIKLLSEFELRALYRGSWLIRRIIDTPAKDMTRKMVELKIHEGGDAEDAAQALNIYSQGSQSTSPYSRQTSGHDAFREAKRLADWFGRSYIVMRVNGGESPEEPLTQVRNFEGLTVLDRYQLRPAVGTLNSQDPEFYQLTRDRHMEDNEFNLLQKIHHSRVLVFDGAKIHPYDAQIEGDGGHDSVLQGIYEIFVRHYMAKDAISKGLDSYSINKVSIKGLKDILTTPKGDELVAKMMREIQQMMSLHRVLFQDAEASNSEFQNRTFSGVHENFQGIVDELTASTGLPFYKIWGTVGKAALSDSGGAETRAYAEQVQGWQFADFMGNHRILFHAIFEAMGKVPSSWEIEYPSIYTETPEEISESRRRKAETYEILTRAQIVTTDEVREAIATGQEIENVIEVEGVNRGDAAPKFDAEPLFQPSLTILPADTYFNSVARIDWDTVRSIADEQGWQWNAQEGQYYDRDLPVADDEILEVTQQLLDNYEGQIDAVTALLESKRIDVSEWEERIARITAGVAAQFFLFGFGNNRQLQAVHREHVEERLRTQLQYLRGFSEGVLSGLMTLGGIAARAKLYVHDAQLHYSEAQEYAHSVDEWPYYSNVLGGCRHCPQCSEQTSLGIVRRGTLVPIGNRLCRWRCCCSYFYYRNTEG